LLIRGAEAADFAGADEQALKVNCNMAQAFKISRGNRTAHPGQLRDRLASAARRTSNAFQIAAPVRSIGRIGFWNMGPPMGRRKRRAASKACLA
jgi:hypothetical protein